jgi:endoglycosylceramidase
MYHRPPLVRLNRLGALLLLAACSADGAELPNVSPLWSDGQHFRDDQGRIALLRGINARVEGVFDVTFDDGRPALEDIPPLTAADCARMRELGLNVLRLPINWSGIEPKPGEYDDDYFRRVDESIRCAAEADLLVLVDLHQDAYSKEIGEDGAPLWAIVPRPRELLAGPLDEGELYRRRTSAPVLQAFASFFDPNDDAGLQQAFNRMLAVVAGRYADEPAVVGFEIYNEPVASADQLEPFHEAAAAAIHAAAPRKLIFFEPSAFRNLLDSQPLAAAPFPVAGGVYAPHIYTAVFDSTDERLRNLSKADLEPSVRAARAEAAAWGTPLFIGEYGVGPEQVNAESWLTWQLELHDQYLASNAFWLWKESSQGRWGLYDLVDGTWRERPQMIAWLSRIYPQRIAGTGPTLRSSGGVMRLTVDQAVDAAHVVYIPEASAQSFTASCDGQPLTAPRDPATGTVELTCAGELVVSP